MTIVAAEERGRQLRSVGPLADADAPLLPEHDPQRLRRIAKDRLVGREQRAGECEPIAGRRSHDMTTRHAEHPAKVDKGAQGASLETEHACLLASVVDNGVLKECQWREAPKAV